MAQIQNLPWKIKTISENKRSLKLSWKRTQNYQSFTVGMRFIRRAGSVWKKTANRASANTQKEVLCLRHFPASSDGYNANILGGTRGVSVGGRQGPVRTQHAAWKDNWHYGRSSGSETRHERCPRFGPWGPPWIQTLCRRKWTSIFLFDF